MESTKTLEQITAELDDLQQRYVEEEDEMLLMKMERQFGRLLQDATDLDGVDRIAAGITIHNWTISED